MNVFVHNILSYAPLPHCEEVALAALCNQHLYLLLHESVFSTVRFRGVN